MYKNDSDNLASSINNLFQTQSFYKKKKYINLDSGIKEKTICVRSGYKIVGFLFYLMPIFRLKKELQKYHIKTSQ